MDLLVGPRGYHKTSMDAIAAAVGIQKASLYHHFESKEAIVLELHRSIIDRLFELHRSTGGVGRFTTGATPF
jgi:TetR/AcrR family transcriptional regulator, cholesterol catabolism regulator